MNFLISFFNKSYNQVKDKIIKKCPKCALDKKPGYLYYDYHTFDLFVIYCTECKFREKIIRDAVNVEFTKEERLCPKETCKAKLVTVDVENPFLSGETCYTGCLFCDDVLR